MRLTVGTFDRRPITRWVAVFLLAVEAIFLNLIVPGHTRGVITLSGKCSCNGLADLGCPLCAHRVSDDPKKAPTSQDRCDCAICHLAVCMMSTPPVDLGLGELGLLKLISPPASEEITIAAMVRTYDGRGPPPASL
jgi:hypothetical protein